MNKWQCGILVTMITLKAEWKRDQRWRKRLRRDQLGVKQRTEANSINFDNGEKRGLLDVLG